MFCSHLELECRFTAAARRGRGPLTTDTDANADADAGDSVQASAIAEAVTSSPVAGLDSRAQTVPPGHNSPGRDAGGRAGLRGPAAPHSMRASPEPPQITDQQGHYVGPASGVSFLLRIQRKLQIRSPGYLNSSIFNFGDRPLPGQDPSFVILPPKPLAEAMVERYFDFAAATHRFLHRPTVETWLRELYDTDGAMLYQETARSQTALLFVVFAHSNNYQGQSKTGTQNLTTKSGETG